MQINKYLMEHEEEALRLDIKTNSEIVAKQALWAGIKAGMHVADIGCGSGKTSSILYKLIQPDGMVTGLDSSEQRIKYAKEHYSAKQITFKCRNIQKSLIDLGMFDFALIRFLLEYYRTTSFDVVKNVSQIIKPGGILCLIDLDYNCLSHFGLSSKLEKTIFAIQKLLEEKEDFDAYMGRRLYSFLYDLGYQDINVEVAPHHLIFGQLKDTDAFNWMKKFEVISRKINFHFEDYKGGYEEFIGEFKKFFADPRRFTYTPVICCRGRKPNT